MIKMKAHKALLSFLLPSKCSFVPSMLRFLGLRGPKKLLKSCGCQQVMLAAALFFYTFTDSELTIEISCATGAAIFSIATNPQRLSCASSTA